MPLTNIGAERDLSAPVNPDEVVPVPRPAVEGMAGVAAEPQVTKQDAMAAAQLHLGAGAVIDVDALDYEVWTGGANGDSRRKVGGYMVVLCKVASEDGVSQKRIEIDDNRRPLPEKVTTFLGAIAQQKHRNGVYGVSHIGAGFNSVSSAR